VVMAKLCAHTRAVNLLCLAEVSQQISCQTHKHGYTHARRWRGRQLAQLCVHSTPTSAAVRCRFGVLTLGCIVVDLVGVSTPSHTSSPPVSLSSR
jgi:hypothetical protein